jgi:hypothetical protein
VTPWTIWIYDANTPTFLVVAAALLARSVHVFSPRLDRSAPVCA